MCPYVDTEDPLTVGKKNVVNKRDTQLAKSLYILHLVGDGEILW